MPAFDLLQPGSVADAQQLLEQHGSEAWVLAGSLDSFDWLKDRIKKPKVVVDLSGIAELKGIRATIDGIEIGAMATLSQVVNHPLIQREVQPSLAGCRIGRVAADSEPGDHRRQRAAGHEMLVLPLRLALLSCRWKYLLCR